MTNRIITAAALTAALAASGALAAAAPAAADPDGYVFEFRRSALDTEAGREATLTAIADAAENACDDANRLTLQGARAQRACEQRFVVEAITQVGDPRLAAALEEADPVAFAELERRGRN